MTGAPETLELLDVDPALRPLARAMAARRPSWWVLVGLELRKAVGTRGARWSLLAVLVLALGAAVRGATAVPPSVDLARHVDAVTGAVALLLPVVGVLLTAPDWSRRTAASTFALVPQRGRVLTAQLAAAVLVALAVGAAAVLVAAAGALQAAHAAGTPLVLDAGAVLPALLVAVLATLAGAGAGALTGSTAAGVAAATALGLLHLAPGLAGGASGWVDGHRAVEQVAHGSVTSWAATGTALVLWLVLPLVAGTVRVLRRELP